MKICFDPRRRPAGGRILFAVAGVVLGTTGSAFAAPCLTPSFAPATNIAIGPQKPFSVAVGDFNSDGVADLATANYGSGTVSVVLGAGDGGFGPKTNFGVGAEPRDIAVADFNGDGRADFVTANHGSANVSVRLGNGMGGFVAAMDVAVGQAPSSLVVADFNNDGRADIATANRNSNTVSIRRGNGAGSFSGTTNFLVGTGPRTVAAGDFNNDGKLDIVTANVAASSLSVRLGTGTGSFGAITTIAVAGTPRGIAVRDLDGDGDADLAVGLETLNAVGILLGNGAGSFGPITLFATGSLPYYVAAGDFNADAVIDLAVANSGSNDVSILLGTGLGDFGPATPLAAGSKPYTIVATDLSGDGRIDLAVANSTATKLSLILNTCDGDACVATCAALDPCHDVGTCDPSTGLCSAPEKANGTPCDDGDACTQTDTCQAGVCAGADPILCTASDPCHLPGTCDATTGACSNPPVGDGTSCGNDGATCGDGIAQPGEACDGGDLSGHTCASLGHVDGALACSPTCDTFVTSGCSDCGNDMAQGAEVCDGADLMGQTCLTMGPFSGGSLACNGACTAFDTSSCNGPPTIPGPRFPLNGSSVGSVHADGTRRPAFVWAPAEVAGGAAITYELQYGTDPGFAGGVTNVSTPSLDHQPPTDLAVAALAPVGARYFWRVRACAGAACSAFSPARYVDVGRTGPDFNGDGYADLVVGVALDDTTDVNAGAVSIYFGGPGSTFETTPNATLLGEAREDGFGISVAWGDVNGDGFADLVVGASKNDAAGADAGAAYVYLGGAGDSFDATPDKTLLGATAGDVFGFSVAAADVNGDGFADIAVGAPRDGTSGAEAGAAYIYFGAPDNGFDDTPDGELVGAAAGDMFGVSLAARGDVDEDGFADVVVGAPRNDAAGVNAGAAYLFLGGAGSSFDSTPDGELLGLAAGDELGLPVAVVGDVNGDRFEDIVVGARRDSAVSKYAGAAYVYFGGSSFDGVADGVLRGAAAFDQLGTSVSGAGDVNGDGFADVVVGGPLNDAAASAAGAAYIYLGGPGATFDTTADSTVVGARARDVFGSAVAGAGDTNGDGYGDVVVGAPWNDAAGRSAGAVYLFPGATGGVAPAPIGVIRGRASADELGATVL